MSNGKMMNGTHSYQELLQKFEPRPIGNEEQYDAVVAQINALIDKQNMLYGLDLLRSLVAEAKLQAEDLLPVFDTKAAVINVLRGESIPSPDQVDKLSTFFGLPEPLFTFTDNRAFS